MDHLQLFETILNENKDNLITKKGEFLSDGEKEELKALLKKYPDLENKIDWNKKVLGTDDIAKIRALTKDRETSYKQSGNLESIWKKFGENVEILKCEDQKIYVAPLTKKAAEFMNSFNCYGLGARWCIGTKGNDSFWNSYNSQDTRFIMYYDDRPDFKYKFMIQLEPRGDGDLDEITVWNSHDDIEIEGFYKTGNNYEEILDFIELTDEELTAMWNTLDECRPEYDEED